MANPDVNQIVDHFNKLQESPETKRKDDFVLGDPKCLRLRDSRGIAPSKIFIDTVTLKDICQSFAFTSYQILVQKVSLVLKLAHVKLAEEEVKKSRETIVLFLQQFFPSTWTFGPRFELSTSDEEKLTDFRDRVVK